ncbi:NAD(P)-binding domain-containing protein [bacterium]|nr:NAD(P)-binding domain-containing protein [bacterium]
MIDQWIQIGAVALAVGIPVIYWLRYRRKSNRARAALESAVESGLTEPVSLHPKIDPNSCISTGACVEACPEKLILGIVDNRAQLVSPSKCIGHGACQNACPTDAISLVFGTESRGVDIPHVKETFETNVPGIYIAGELGGMGLIRNAVTQGREAVEYIARSISGNGASDYDLVIVGAGPAGLAATLEARKRGLKYLTVEQEGSIGGTVLHYPRQKLVMTQPMVIPMYGPYKRREISKEELVELWQDVVTKSEIEVRCSEKVEAIERTNGHFTIKTTGGKCTAKKVLLAIGRRGTPRKLGVKGEHATKVAYKLLEPEQYAGTHVLVVGGGDSAVEAALSLGEQEGTTVTLSYRKDRFSRIKDGNRERLERAMASGWVRVILESSVIEIHTDEVLLQTTEGERTIPNDSVFVMIGGELPTAFLEKVGIRMERKYGER